VLCLTHRLEVAVVHEEPHQIVLPTSALHPGAVAELAEQRKAKAYAKLSNMDAARANIVFFAIELLVVRPQ
jgi:hypothetical protein